MPAPRSSAAAAVLSAGTAKQVRAEPFDAFELDLSVLGADVVLPESGER